MTWVKISLFLGIHFALESKIAYQAFAWKITVIYGKLKC